MKRGGGGKEGGFIFCALPIFRAAKTRALFSFRLKRTGTLATQASYESTAIVIWE